MRTNGERPNEEKIGNLAKHGIFIAVIAMLTLFASIPLPAGSGGAYLNAGDAAIYVASYVLGPVGGMITAAIGSAAADMLHGSMIYAPATFIIKGLMGLCAGFLYKRIRHGAPLAAGMIMPAGYFAFEFVLFRESALFGLWTNAIQYAFGVLASTVLIMALERARAVTPWWERKNAASYKTCDTDDENNGKEAQG
ncbi:MAG: ECF transporter S component [Clostridiales bacterium]|nr:ECF transporter S component [Clostridiales bacterium]